MSFLDDLQEITEDVKKESKGLPDGEYVGVISKVTLKEDNQWRDGTVVPLLTLDLVVTEGEFEGVGIPNRFNLGGRDIKGIKTSLSVFLSAMSRIGLDTENLTIEETIEATADLVDTEVRFKVSPQKNNPEYKDVLIIESC